MMPKYNTEETFPYRIIITVEVMEELRRSGIYSEEFLSKQFIVGDQNGK